MEMELQRIRTTAMEMMNMVKNQLAKGKIALLDTDKELALEVVHNEKRVNGFELMIDSDIENLIACFGPVAIDLRFALATLKINYHLERIGDNAEGISRNVLDIRGEWNRELLEKLSLVQAFDTAVQMFELIVDAYSTENTSKVRQVFSLDETMDEIADNALITLTKHLEAGSDSVEKDLYLLLIHRKLERVGDLLKNIAEEIIFYVEAKVLKHMAKS